MSDKNLQQIPAHYRELYQCGMAALEQNDTASAKASFLTALESEPGFVDCRQALRRAQKQAAEARPALWARICRHARNSLSLTKASLLLGFRPLQAISIAERALNDEPENVSAHKLLAKAALAADLPRTATLSLEALAGEHPAHRALKLKLAESLAKSGHSSEAATIYGQLLKDNPRDGTVLRALQNFSVAPAAPEASPKTNGHVVDMPASAKAGLEPNGPPKASPSVSEDDAIITRLEPLLGHCPKNTRVLKNLAEAYQRKDMFDQALSFYQQALKIAGGKNAEIERSIGEINMKKLESELSRLDHNAPSAAALRERIQNLRLEYKWHEMETAH